MTSHMESNNLETQAESGAKNIPENNDQEEPKFEMEKLPQEIVHQILVKLPFSSLIRFKCACKAWKTLAQDHYLENSFNHRSIEENKCLILHSVKPSENELSFVDFNSIEDTKTKKIQIPFSTSEFEIVASCNGLLCISDSSNGDLYIFNPFTSEYRQLPETTESSPILPAYGFGFHPKTKEYKVVKVSYNRPTLVLTLGASSWRSLEPTEYLLNSYLGNQVVLDKRLNWLCCSNRYVDTKEVNIVSFDLEDERFRIVPVPDYLRLNSISHVVLLKGCLGVGLVTSYRGRMEIWVMKEYDVIESWVNAYNIDMSSYESRYVPRALREELDDIYESVYHRRRFDGVLCELSNGEILLLYNSRALVVYDPKSGIFTDVVFEPMPKLFYAVFHLGNLNHIDAIVGCQI